MKELQSFISDFGDYDNYDDYYQDLYQQALQREIQLHSKGDQQQQNQESDGEPNQEGQSQNNTVSAATSNDINEGQNKVNLVEQGFLKNCFDKVVQSIVAFMINPINILRCLLLALSLLFFSSYFSIPDMSKQPPTEVFNWLAYNRASRMLVATGSLSFCCFILFGVRQLYIVMVGTFRVDQEKAILNLYLEQNPILHISIIYMTDPNIIPQKFDLAIWLCFYFTFSTFKIFHNICSQQLKMILQNINDDYQEELKCIVKIQRFSAILFLINLWICSLGIWVFSLSGYYKLSLLFYEGILFAFDSFKIVLCTTKLRDHMNFYVNYNTEEIHDPFFKRETLFDSFYHMVQLIHFMQLIYNYFFKLDYQFIMHLWLLYLFKKINISLKQLKNNFQAYVRYRSIQKNLDNMFPRVDMKELSEDDVCSICHDELLIARRIETCGHKFHIKCLFKWLKSQQNSRCPICRSEIPNLNFDNAPNKPSFITNFLDYLARIFMPTINFIFEPRVSQNENVPGNNQNDNNENDLQNISANENDIQENQGDQVYNSNGGGNNSQYRNLNRNNLNENGDATLADLLNQNYFDLNSDRDMQMYNQISQLISSSASKIQTFSNSQENDDLLHHQQVERQALKSHILDVIRQNINTESQQQINSNEKHDQVDDFEEDDYGHFDYNDEDIANNSHCDEEYLQGLNTMDSTKMQLLSLKNNLMNLQEAIMSKDSSVNTEEVLTYFKSRLEREQKNLINFLMNKLVTEDNGMASLVPPQLQQEILNGQIPQDQFNNNQVLLNNPNSLLVQPNEDQPDNDHEQSDKHYIEQQDEQIEQEEEKQNITTSNSNEQYLFQEPTHYEQIFNTQINDFKSQSNSPFEQSNDERFLQSENNQEISQSEQLSECKERQSQEPENLSQNQLKDEEVNTESQNITNQLALDDTAAHNLQTTDDGDSKIIKSELFNEQPLNNYFNNEQTGDMVNYHIQDQEQNQHNQYQIEVQEIQHLEDTVDNYQTNQQQQQDDCPQVEQTQINEQHTTDEHESESLINKEKDEFLSQETAFELNQQKLEDTQDQQLPQSSLN